ncbi:MAG: hypothetical protein M5U12_10525 [Verrucomicrobia bacterium]|nr:hypothetical protein [Verrucomicrobiota bacterium]
MLLMVLVGAMSNAAQVRPHWTGKVATVLQMSCVVWALLKWDTHWLFWLAVAATGFTALSGLIYLPAGLAMVRAKAHAGGLPRT